MSTRCIIVASIVHHAVCDGFLPASIKLGYHTHLLTDYSDDYEKALAPEVLTHVSVHQVDVNNPLYLIKYIEENNLNPTIIFSNSDYLQASVALSAEYFGCLHKDWKVCLTTKNKLMMRRRLEEKSFPVIHHQMLSKHRLNDVNLSYPVIAKPTQGIESKDVRLCKSEQELATYCRLYLADDQLLYIEEYVEGPIVSLETLGDCSQIKAIAGFDVTFSAPPVFIEEQVILSGHLISKYKENCLAQIKSLGVGFGACHSEFIITDEGPKLIEVNYRCAGDVEYMLDELSGGSWFSSILQLYQGNPVPEFDYWSHYGGCAFVSAEKSGVLSILEAEAQQGSQFVPLKKLGDAVQVNGSDKDHLAMIQCVGRGVDEVKQTLSRSLSSVKFIVDAAQLSANLD